MMRLLILLIGAAVCFNHANISPLRLKVYTLSPEVEVQIPPPPLCNVKFQTSASAVPTTITLWRTSSAHPVSSGLMVRKVKMVTSCFTGILGTHDKSLIKKTALKVSPREILEQPYRSQVETEWSDMTDEPAYLCRWLATETTSSIRFQSRVVDMFLTEKGHVMADGITWTPTEARNVWENGLEMITTRTDLSKTCPFVPFQTVKGVSVITEDESIVFLGTQSHMRIVIDPLHQATECSAQRLVLHPTDIGIPVTYNISSPIRFDSDKGLVTLQNRILPAEESLFQSSVLFELQQVVNKVNHNFESLDSHLCKLRTQTWSNLVRRGTPDEMATYITGDIFARGRLNKGKLHIRVRQPEIVEASSDGLKILENNRIQISLPDRTLIVEPGSGIINPVDSKMMQMPPLVEMESGSYFNLLSNNISADGPSRWVHSQILIDNLNVTRVDTSSEEGHGRPEDEIDLHVHYISFLESWYRHYWFLIVTILSCVILFQLVKILKKRSWRIRCRIPDPESPEVPLRPISRSRRTSRGRSRTRSRSPAPNSTPGWRRRYF